MAGLHVRVGVRPGTSGGRPAPPGRFYFCVVGAAPGVAALKAVPQLNAEIQGKEIVYHRYYHIGIAVASPRGLVVPVVRDASRMSTTELAAAIGDDAATNAGADGHKDCIAVALRRPQRDLGQHAYEIQRTDRLGA